MNVLIQVDKNYVNIACVMLYSLLSNNEYDIDVYLLHYKLDEKYIELLNNQCQYFNNQNRKCRLIPINVDGAIFESYKMRPSITNTAFYKLTAFKYLPNDINKILYLDSDIIVKGDIKNLYDLKFEDLTLFYAGSECQTSQYEFERLGYDYKKMKEEADYIYINSGVLLINCALMRQQVTVEDIITFIEMKKHLMSRKDEDVINGLFFPYIKYFSARDYNYISFLLTYDDKTIEAIDKAKILHFAGPPQHKPWCKEYHSYGHALNIYKEYAKESLSSKFMLNQVNNAEKNLDTNHKRWLKAKQEYQEELTRNPKTAYNILLKYFNS